MLCKYNLNGVWKARGFDGQHGVPEAFCTADADERTFIDACVPGDIHLDLERAGIIPDCNIDLNAQSARWVEEQVWVYRTRFTAPKDALSRRSWLVFDGLDLHAVVYLNGHEIGRHDNAYVPCRLEVTEHLREGENVLAVRIESGLYAVSEKPGKGYNPSLDHVLHKRAWLRKPQYQFSWDWNPRLVNVGIWRGVRIEYTDSPRIDSLTVYPVLAQDHSRARIHTRVYIDNVRSEGVSVVVRTKVPEADAVLEHRVDLEPGVSRHDLSVEIENPRLWWPRPHGDQPLYTVQVEVEIDGKVIDQTEHRTGIRSVKIQRDPHPEAGEYFIIEVNGRPIFAKGGNWVPADMIYARASAEHHRKLVELAAGANFNTLRIWGGGLYADRALLDACDELGIMVWHDFLFACSKYPGDDAEFLQNVRREIEFAVRDLSPHPSLVVWCGNNELELAAWEWGYDREHPHPDYALYHFEIPRILRREDPSRPYWPSSPFSPDCCSPKDPTCGDQHPWHVSLGAGYWDFWEYRKDVSRFPNEGGVLGASSLATIRQFLPESQRKLFSPAWEFHDNACNYWRGPLMHDQIAYAALEQWLGLKADEVEFEDYIFYSGVLQSEGLQEYIYNYRRRMYSSASAIFWMYNDSWPVSHGWTIVDYYMRRKLAYFPVKRAFAPVCVVPVVEGDEIAIYGVNETLCEWGGEARYGLFNLAGGLPVDNETMVILAPNAASVVGRIPLAQLKKLGEDNAGAFALLTQNGRIFSQNRIFTSRFKDLNMVDSPISVERRCDKAVFSSPAFVWGVCLDHDGEAVLPDDIFDLLPGIDYEIDWPQNRPLPKVQRRASPILK